ncbi:GPP34 family phosphoprotein [Aureivirga sp. CE67]|uniref:GPP34 family phosphoprotein n=1 Tax=Aureivirga sp. CE67 TaxID=1788983 RepID=UPI0018C96D3D|nr:GPP34 family phosphoprotein [Aureivirga sp. CE67]
MELGIKEKFLLMRLRTQKKNYVNTFKVLERSLLLFDVLEMFQDNELLMERKKLSAGKFSSDNARKKVFYEMVKFSTRKRSFNNWMQRFYLKKNKYIDESLRRLEAQSIIKIENGKFLGVFPVKTIVLLKPKVKIDLANQLEKAIQQGHYQDKKQTLLLRQLDNNYFYYYAFENKTWKERSELKKQNKKQLKAITMNSHEKIVNNYALHLAYNGYA